MECHHFIVFFCFFLGEGHFSIPITIIKGIPQQNLIQLQTSYFGQKWGGRSLQRCHLHHDSNQVANLCREDEDCQYVPHYANHPNHALKQKGHMRMIMVMMRMMRLRRIKNPKVLTKATPSNQKEQVSPMAIISSGKISF